MSSRAIEEILKSIEEYVSKTGEKYLSYRTIESEGWLVGAKYASIKKMAEKGLIKTFSLNLGSEKRQPIKKVHYKDLEEYLQKNYKN